MRAFQNGLDVLAREIEQLRRLVAEPGVVVFGTLAVENIHQQVGKIDSAYVLAGPFIVAHILPRLMVLQDRQGDARRKIPVPGHFITDKAMVRAQHGGFCSAAPFLIPVERIQHTVVLLAQGAGKHQFAEILQQAGDEHLFGVFARQFLHDEFGHGGIGERALNEGVEIKTAVCSDLVHRHERERQYEALHRIGAKHGYRLRDRADLLRKTVEGRIRHLENLGAQRHILRHHRSDFRQRCILPRRE